MTTSLRIPGGGEIFPLSKLSPSKLSPGKLPPTPLYGPRSDQQLQLWEPVDIDHVALRHRDVIKSDTINESD